MADSVPMTPPRERKAGSSITRFKQEGVFIITDVDQEQHTINLNVDGYPVTLTCSPQNNPKSYHQVKTILLDMVAADINTII